jgi:hypothetical protein
MAAADKMQRNGYSQGRSVSAPVISFVSRQVLEEAEKLLAAGNLAGFPRVLLEEFLYAQRLQLLESEASSLRAAELQIRLQALKAEGLARWAQQCTVPSQQGAFLERFSALEQR